MEFIEYQPWHYEYLVGITKQGIIMGKDIVRMFGEAYYLKGNTYTVKHNGNIIGCGGIIEMWPGVAEAWVALTEEFKQHPFFLHKYISKILRMLIAKNNYHRLQANVSLDNHKAIKWVERLGFELESVMKRFGADKMDHAMYVWRQ